MYRTVDFQLGALSFHLELFSKFTVLTGDSATGKTTLLERSNEFPGQSTTYPDFRHIRATDNVDVIDTVLNSCNPNTVLFIDEGTIPTLRKCGRLRKLNSLNTFIIIASRAPLFDLMYSYTDVYVLTDTIPIRNMRLFPDYLRLERDSVYYTEDAVSGYQYYSKWLEGSVQHAKDTTHFSDCTSGTIIADGAVLGPQIMRWASDGCIPKLFAPISFEYLICKHFRGTQISEILESVDLTWKSLERFFTSYVRNNLFPGYDKSECPQEVLDADLLTNFRGSITDDVFNRYCEHFSIVDRESEIIRLTQLYGTADFYDKLVDDFGV